MKSVLVQFHTTHQEFADFLTGVAIELGLHLVLRRSKPKLPPKEIAIDDIINVIMDNIDVEYKQIIVLIDKPNIDLNGNFLNIDPCEGAIEFCIGALTSQYLRQSSFSVITDNQHVLEIANKIATKLKKITKAGVTAAIDKSIVYRTERYTEKAMELQNQGIKKMPFADACELKLGIES